MRIISSDTAWQSCFLEAVTGLKAATQNMKIAVGEFVHNRPTFKSNLCFNRLLVPSDRMDKESFLLGLNVFINDKKTLNST